jgi:hypothetical protein
MSTSLRDMRHAGELDSGVEVDGQFHRAFELRLPTVQDNIDAVDEVGSHNGVALSAAILTRQLVKLGSLEQKQITFELIAGMHPVDFNKLEAAAAELEKKRLAAARPASTGTESGSGLSAPA